MGLKINITYSMDIEKVPQEIQSKLNELEMDFDTHRLLLKSIAKELSTTHISVILEKLDKWRQKLVEFDQQLNDYSLILADYEKKKTELYIQEHSENTIEVDDILKEKEEINNDKSE